MRQYGKRVAAFTAVFALLAVPLLPPEHLHRGPVGAHYAGNLIHRHFAPHTTADGTHVGHPGVAEGAPVWLADPASDLQDVVSLPTARIPARADERPHPRSVGILTATPDRAIHAPPLSSVGLRAPPALS